MKFICYIIIMWFLNYCSPFLFNDTDTINTYRTLMYSEILGVFCIYIVFITIYKIAGGNSTTILRNQNGKGNLQESAQVNLKGNDRIQVCQRGTHHIYLRIIGCHKRTSRNGLWTISPFTLCQWVSASCTPPISSKSFLSASISLLF